MTDTSSKVSASVNRGRTLLARVIALVTSLCALVLFVGALCVVFGANEDNALVAWVLDTADWLDANPAGGLISVWGDHRPDNMNSDGMLLGYIPEMGAQEGIVYTLRTAPGGIAVRAEIAAQTADASCPELPDGAQYGAPGMG